jgi:hypothetical protein
VTTLDKNCKAFGVQQFRDSGSAPRHRARGRAGAGSYHARYDSRLR